MGKVMLYSEYVRHTSKLSEYTEATNNIKERTTNEYSERLAVELKDLFDKYTIAVREYIKRNIMDGGENRDKLDQMYCFLLTDTNLDSLTRMTMLYAYIELIGENGASREEMSKVASNMVDIMMDDVKNDLKKGMERG